MIHRIIIAHKNYKKNKTLFFVYEISSHYILKINFYIAFSILQV